MSKLMPSLSFKAFLEKAVEKWVEQFPFLETAPWNKIFKMIHHSDYETYLQSFQYKIINRILNCNYNLHVWKIKNKKKCGLMLVISKCFAKSEFQRFEPNLNSGQ